MNKDEMLLVGKKVVSMSIDGHGIEMIMEDGTRFWYFASDGGYGSWEVEKDGDK